MARTGIRRTRIAAPPGSAGRHGLVHRVTRAAAVAACVCAMWTATDAAPQPAQRPVVIAAEYEGIIHPVAAEFVNDVLARAAASGAEAVVLTLRTPGGLLESTRAIVSSMIASPVPVVVFVGPSGARAASAGFLITLAADVAVMAPGTHIGAAHPVSAGGQQAAPDETMAKKAAADTAAYARTLAESRRRNPGLAAEAVLESRAFTATEALEADPPLIDFTARDLNAVLEGLEGRTIRRSGGREVVLRTADPVIERMEMSRRQQFLSALAHPQVAYLLMTLGTLGLIVEFWQPGSILPGVAGGLCLLLAFFAFQILPLNVAGVLLMIFGLALLAFELKVPSFGVLGAGGILALAFGSIMVTREVPGVEVSFATIAAVVIALGGIFLFLGRLGLQAHRAKPTTGVEGLVGEVGQTITALAPGQPGQVRVHGEIWRAVADNPLDAGRPIQVIGISGLTLQVAPLGTLAAEGDRP